MSWLNARAKDTVGLKMEKGLWSEARAFVEGLQRKEEGSAYLKEAKDGAIDQGDLAGG